MNIENLNSKIRKLKLQIVDNLDDQFNPLNIELDGKLENELALLCKERSKFQKVKIDTLSNMYLRTYAWVYF